MSSITSENRGKLNRLANEKSPYLQQHATNPVDWYPWGEEALNAAKKQDKPIFLSIGYSTCHWCHVMEHESFEDPKVAEVMNKNFINIKVDREERPDLDAIYMEAVMLLTGSGGWPMSVWLTPDLKPFYGGTYFPPEDRYGRPSFTTVLVQLAQAWEKKRDRVLGSSEEILAALKHSATASFKETTALPSVKDVFETTFQSLSSIYDSVEGGFGPPPKFPMPVYMDFLLKYHARNNNAKALEMVRLTMTKMLGGGIYDQLGGGFARYSTDALWVVPHFEKMLYDNGQLISVLADLVQVTKDPLFSQAIRESLTYVLRDMTHPDGAFYSAEDADSEGKEGTFYLWTLAEVKKVLGDKVADPFIFRYGLTVNGNFMDPHTQEIGKNILVKSKTIEETADKFKQSVEETQQILTAAEKKLFDVRSRRIRPHLDDKILTGWNGLMISAFSKSGAVLNEPTYLESAQKAARFIQANLYDLKSKTLYRRWRENEKKVKAHQIDYALLVQGLIDLYEATGQTQWISWATELQSQHDTLFWDKEKGGYFMTIPIDDLLIRMKDDRDNVIPSGNSVAVLNGFRLASITGNEKFKEKADATMKTFSKVMETHPVALVKMLTGYDFNAGGHLQVVVVGAVDKEETKSLINQVHEIYHPQKLVFLLDPKDKPACLSNLNPFLKNMKMIDDKPTAYVCVDYACKNPTSDKTELKAQLESITSNNQ